MSFQLCSAGFFSSVRITSHVLVNKNEMLKGTHMPTLTFTYLKAGGLSNVLLIPTQGSQHALQSLMNCIPQPQWKVGIITPIFLEATEAWESEVTCPRWHRTSWDSVLTTGTYCLPATHQFTETEVVCSRDRGIQTEVLRRPLCHPSSSEKTSWSNNTPLSLMDWRWF